MLYCIELTYLALLGTLGRVTWTPAAGRWRARRWSPVAWCADAPAAPSGSGPVGSPGGSRSGTYPVRSAVSEWVRLSGPVRAPVRQWARLSVSVLQFSPEARTGGRVKSPSSSLPTRIKPHKTALLASLLREETPCAKPASILV